MSAISGGEQTAVMARMDAAVAVIARRTAGLLRVRWLVRAPVWLYRRYVVLEVVGHPRVNRWIVVSGFGDRSQWFRNLRANPEVRVYVRSRRPQPATASLLDRREAETALTPYAEADPSAWRTLRPVLEQTLGAPITEAATSLPLVALDLTEPAAGRPTAAHPEFPTRVSPLTGVSAPRAGTGVANSDVWRWQGSPLLPDADEQ